MLMGKGLSFATRLESTRKEEHADVNQQVVLLGF